MQSLENKNVLVLGLGLSGRSASRLLVREGARVAALDETDGADRHPEVLALRQSGVDVRTGPFAPQEPNPDLVVTSPGIPSDHPFLKSMAARQVPVIGELELGFLRSACHNIAVSGTNGKTTTTELIGQVLSHSGRQTICAGNIGRPLCDVVEMSRELDYLTLEVSSFQLDHAVQFRPSVAVLTGISPDHVDRYASMDDYVRSKGRLFQNQQHFDHAVIQSGALGKLREAGVRIPSRIVTYSATDREADLVLDRGMIVSHLSDWAGPLVDLKSCRLPGAHNAENMMAALAVGRILRLPLDPVVRAVQNFNAGRHRCEEVAVLGGVRYVNDSKATNVDALNQAIRAMAGDRPKPPHIWLIAGGYDKGFDYHDAGPLLSQHVKAAYLIGQARERIRSAWSLFTQCELAETLEQALLEATGRAEPGDVVLLSPACSSFDQFKNYQERGDVFCKAVRDSVSTMNRNRPSRRREPVLNARAG